MKYLIVIVALSLSIVMAHSAYAQFGGILGTVKSTVEQKVDEKVQKKTAEAMDTVLQNGSPQQPGASNSSGSSGSTSNTAVTGQPTTAPQTIAAYQNYDFKPGDNIIFEDHFTDDQDGEFPAHWVFQKGTAVVNKVQGEPAFLFTENWTTVTPRMKTDNYLTDPFTTEFDYYLANDETPSTIITLRDANNEGRAFSFGSSIGPEGFEKSSPSSKELKNDSFFGKWHHAALIYRHGQMKGYIDNVRDLVVPDAEIVPVKLEVNVGFADDKNPVAFKNFRVASGGSSNTIASMLTNGKFVTHGITFDVGKATLRPESMGTLNDVAKYLKENSSANFEIDGHTDSDGLEGKNMTLSQQRADAVKTQLAAMGVEALRLSTKGFGATKPVASNDTPEGKANNRRVEFIKM